MSPQPGIPLQERARLYGDLVCSFVQRSGPVLLLTEMPGNIGDHLIWAGTERLLDSRGVSFDRLPVPALDQGSDLRLGGTLVVPGSGAWTACWHEWLPGLVLRASRLVDRVVVLPSSYDVSVAVVAEALSRPNVYAFCREPRSYRQIKGLGRAALALDPALYALDFVVSETVPASDLVASSALVALRTDSESLLAERGWSPTVGANNDISVTAENVADFLERIRSSSVVVTDRLHVVVAAVMLGKQAHFVDTFNRKISTYADYTFRQEFRHQLVEHDEQWLAEHGFVEPARES